jgi:hypothetical protein
VSFPGAVIGTLADEREKLSECSLNFFNASKNGLPMLDGAGRIFAVHNNLKSVADLVV